MKKFFRKIRYNLIETGKTTKYFKYAIGEIILVVIGILIALQINNWNENRKSEKDKQKLMFALKQEFLINKNTLENHLVGLHKSNAQLNRLVNYSAGAIELPSDSLKLYASNIVYPITLSMLNSVLDEAISAGKFEMLSDSLKQKLSLLIDYTKSRKKISENLDKITVDTDDEVTELYLSLSAFPEVPNKYYVQKPTVMHPDFIKNNEELELIVKSSKTYSKLHQIYYFSISDEIWIKYGLLRLTTEIIDVIDKELKE
ncbi:DUF6090 family protein [Psychroserpens sp. AS72]|uniref:DUF6090 family protein n=1 Tax=Psychroserpens sp. AS72 TaxID=3135775 RepID=UPI00316D46C0